ncbi:cytochrome P450 [Umezawaea tangerina]|uniref:Cytochrome P450 n=1 Tax=Umezawaea tangerina TaxID=84725 RepID=A0A2T0SZZ2_9PSEU|nr:cytochrome P450 [Umezawaea tangerina]PRY38981.1 cytochrome P450 [Umezawaea tangerina]
MAGALAATAAGGLAMGTAAACWRWHNRPVRVPDGTVHPPLALAGRDGIPVYGLYTRLRSVLTDPVELVRRNAEQYGAMFTLRVPKLYDMTYLLYDDAYAMVMNLPADHATLGAVLSKVPTMGYWFPRTGRDTESLQRLVLIARRTIAEMLSQERIARLPDLIADVVEQRVAAWPRTVDLTEAVHPLVYEVVGRYFAGDQLWSAVGPRLTGLYRKIVDGSDVLRAALAMTPMHYAMPEYHATRGLHRLLSAELGRFDSASSPLLTAIDRVRVDGQPLSVADARWMFMAVIWYATSYPGTYNYWTLVDVLARPALVERVHGADTPAARRELLARCLLETVRLNPVSLLIRFLRKPLEFEREGVRYHLPAGSSVVVAPGVINRDSTRVHDRPDDYDPDRHLQEPAPRTASFGRGPFSCVAQQFNKVLTAGLLAELLTRFDVELLDDARGRLCRVHQIYPSAPLRAVLTPLCVPTKTG